MDNLQNAIYTKNLEKVQELLENPEILSTLNTKRVEDGKSYLYFAIYYNVNEDIILALINKGADINFIYTDEDGLQIPVFRYLLSKQALRMEYDNILIEFIRRGVRDIPWYDESIGTLILNASVPNPENYRHPDMISPDLITSEFVTVTYMEYNSETDSYTESQPIHMSKENAFSVLNTSYRMEHGDLYTIKWENNILQTCQFSSPDVPMLIHFKYFEHSRLDYERQYVIHKKIVNPSDSRNPSSYYPSPDVEICNIYVADYILNQQMLFGSHIKFFDAPIIHTIVGATPDNYTCIPDRDTPRNDQDKTWSIINDRPILEMSEFSTDVFSSDMITVDNDPPVNRETAMSLLNLSDKMTWTSGDGKKLKLIITSYRQVSKHYFNFFNYKTDDNEKYLFAILEWDQNGTDTEHNPLYLYKNIKNVIQVDDFPEDDDPVKLVEDKDEYYKSEEFKARMAIESNIRILNVYHVSKNFKQLKADVTQWLEYYFPVVPNYRLNNRWERAGHDPVFPTHEGLNDFITRGEDPYSREEVMMILNYYGILLLPVSIDRIKAWLLTLPPFLTYPLNNRWERPDLPTPPPLPPVSLWWEETHEPVYPTNEEITEFLNSQPAAGVGGGGAGIDVSDITRDDIMMILKYYGIYIQPPLPTNFEEGAVSECAICLNQKNYNIKSMNNPHRVIVLKCGHTFHKHCIERHHAGRLAQHAPFQCPNCRDVYYVLSHTPYVFKGIQLGGSYYEKFQKYKAKINFN